MYDGLDFRANCSCVTNGFYDITFVIQSIENSKYVHAVFVGRLDKKLENTVRIRNEADDILSAEKHLLPHAVTIRDQPSRFGIRCDRRIAGQNSVKLFIRQHTPLLRNSKAIE